MQRKPDAGREPEPRTGAPDSGPSAAKDDKTDPPIDDSGDGLAFEAADWFAAGADLREAVASDPGTPAAEDEGIAPYFDRNPVYPPRPPVDEAESVMDPNADLGFLGRELLPESASTPVWLPEGESEPETPAAGSDDSPEMVQVLRLARSLGKAVKATQLYPLDNPVCARFARELVKDFELTFDLLPELRLTVGKTKFFFRGETVLEQPGREDSVPGRFFWDGVRELTFHAGLTSKEVLDFLSICRKNHETAAEGEDDIVTLLWQKQFEHIAYIAVDDILDLENPDDPVPEEFGKDFMNFVDLDMHNLEDEEEQPQIDQSMAQEIRARLLEDDTELFGISAAERAELLRELEEEDSPKLLEDVFQILLETLFLDPDEDSFVEMVEILATGLVELIRDGRLVLAGTLVRLLTEVRDEREDATPRMRAAVSSGLGQALDPETVATLVDRLNANHAEAVGGLEALVDALPQETTPGLCEMLGRIENPRARRLLVDLLVRRARAGVDLFIEHLRDPRPEMVVDMARILGRTRNDRAVRPLKELMRHPDDRVRVGALEALTELGPAKAGDVLLSALHDADPRVRGAALKSLGRAGRVAVPTLMQMVEEPTFPQRPLGEKKSIFRALGSAGGEDLVPLFEQFLVRKGLFRRGFDDEMRACACEALGWIGGRRATELLEKHVGDKSSGVRSAALAGLRRASGMVSEDEAGSPEEKAA